MIQQIISHFIAHKAAYLLTGAAMGVVATAVFAVKDSDKHSEAIEDFLYDSVDDTDIPEEDKEELIDGVIDPEEFYKEHKTKTERAIIFAKSYWRTGLSMAVTFGLMILSHVTMVKELAAVSAALGVLSTKYKELDDSLKEKFPDAHEKIHQYLDEKNARKAISKNPSIKEESYDGRIRYWEPISNQIFFAKKEDFLEAVAKMNKLTIDQGAGTLYDFLSAFPKSCNIQEISEWMQHFGWFSGSIEESSYEDAIGNVGMVIEPQNHEFWVIADGEKILVHKIGFSHQMDTEPDAPIITENKVEKNLERCKKKPIKEVKAA